MTAAARPFSRRPPTFVTGEPVDGPRNGSVGEEAKRRPFARLMVKQAQGGTVRIVPIDMRQVAFGIAPALPQPRREDADLWLLAQRLDELDDHRRAVPDLHLVGLKQRLERAAPAGGARINLVRPEVRPGSLHRRNLSLDGRNHRRSPRKVWGVAATARLLATVVVPRPTSLGALGT